MKYKKILSEIKKATNIMIVTHESPDGDAIGSSLSMYLVLKQMGKNPDLVIKEYSQCFNFLPSLSYSITIPRNIDYDLVISLDCAKISRLNEIEYVEKAKKIINIDHHISNELYGNYNLVNGEIPACCQLLFNLFRDWKIKMNKEIATSLLVGIITDTNGLRTSGINKDLFLDIYKLLDFDIDLSDLYNRVLTTITKAKFELYKIASNRLEFFCKNKIAFTYITEKDKQEVGAKIGDHEGIVDIGRAIEGVEVSIFLQEYHENKNTFKVSLRSNSYVNVSEIGGLFDGGGHFFASGFTSDLPFNELKNKLVDEVSKRIES